MEYNAVQQHDDYNSNLTLSETSCSLNALSIRKCRHCVKNQLDCDSSIPCSSCIYLGESDNCSTQSMIPSPSQTTTQHQPTETPSKINKSATITTMPAKRGYKSHVPSACINCKIAHLACDVSRPCQRCVTSKKTDTCQDVQHKKRGRPKLREKNKVNLSNEDNYKILYGTIQTPAIIMKNPARNIIPNHQVPPFKTKLTTMTKRPCVISFIHEPIESFQFLSSSKSAVTSSSTPYQQNESIAAASVPLIFDSSANSHVPNTTTTANLLMELNPQQQQQSPPQQQHVYFDYDQSNSNNNVASPTLLNSHTTIITSKAKTPIMQQQQSIAPTIDHHHMSIIMSMEVCCAKVSDQTIQCWGYYPQELAHRSFYDFISPKDTDRLARLHQLLLDNAMNIAQSNTPLPSTERSTSPLFISTEHSQLNVIANGSRSFSDSIHIKKQNGEYELYKVVVYIGGGLGADLYDVTSFSKQYIVAKFRRHEYEVAPRAEALFTSFVTTRSAAAAPSSSALLDNNNSNNNSLKSWLNSTNSYYNSNHIQSIAVFSPMSPLSLTPPNTNSLFNFSSSTSSIDHNSSIHGNNTSMTSVEESTHSLFRVPSNNDNKPLSTTTKFLQMSIIPPPSSPPKFNTIPIATAAHNSSNNSLFYRSPASVSKITSGHSNVSSSTYARLGSTDNVMVTLPTQQYFLQASSNTLNALQHSKTRLGTTKNDNSSSTTANRKIEMSIRSLLC